VLLARSAAYARHRSQYSTLFDFDTMTPLIDGPPFVKALEELVAAANLAATPGGEAPPRYTPREAEREFLAGRSAMALSWPTRAVDGAEDGSDAVLASLRFAELPGSSQVYSLRDQRWEQRGEDETARPPLLAVAGRLGGVARESRLPREALDLLVRLSGKEWSGEVAPHSPDTTLYRASQLPSPDRWVPAGTPAETARQYGELVQLVQNRSAWLFSVRIPGRPEYLKALDDAVRRALTGEQSPAESLQKAAAQWRSITEQRGVEGQRRAYLQSLGLKA
jgi:multiple sugar transport system substrate-binding protein